MSEGKRLISALVRKQASLDEFFGLGLKEELFFNEEEKQLFRKVEAHALKYGAVPTKEVVTDLVPADEPPKYYLDRLEQRFARQRLVKTMNTANEALKAHHDSVDLVLKQVDALLEVDRVLKRQSLIDLRNAHPLVIAEYKKRMQHNDGYIRLGWPTLDNLSDGLMGGDVVSIVGRPAAGKTFLMLWCALQAWKQGYSVMLVSTEMAPLLLIQRLTGMLAGVNYGKLKKAELTTLALTKITKGLKEASKAKVPFHVVDSTLTPDFTQVLRTARQLRPQIVFIDGAYMLHPGTFVKGVYEQVGETARLVKRQLATELDIPVVNSYQFNRDATKQKDAKKLENIGYSDVIGQVSSLILGLMEDDSVETLNARKVDILKGRSGETGEFHVRWDFDNMNFGELSQKDMYSQLEHL